MTEAATWKFLVSQIGHSCRSGFDVRFLFLDVAVKGVPVYSFVAVDNLEKDIFIKTHIDY
jgi:hypothetical protein